MQIGPLTVEIPPSGPDAAKLSPAEAAREFEAMLLAQLIKAARQAGSLTENSSLSGSESYLEFAEKHLAQTLAASGALGFAGMILESFRHEEAREREREGATEASGAPAQGSVSAAPGLRRE